MEMRAEGTVTLCEQMTGKQMLQEEADVSARRQATGTRTIQSLKRAEKKCIHCACGGRIKHHGRLHLTTAKLNLHSTSRFLSASGVRQRTIM